MEYYALGLMSFMVIYLIAHKGVKIDGFLKSMAGFLGVMCLTTLYHNNIAEFIDLGSLWLYFILAYMFFKYLVIDIPIKQIYLIIIFVSLYPLANQGYSILIGTGQMHLGFARYAGTYNHPLAIAFYLFFVIPASIYLFTIEKKIKIKLIYVAILFLCHIGIFMASYRTAWMALFAFWSVYISLVSRKKFLLVLLLGLIMIIIWAFIGKMMSANLMDVWTIFKDPSPLYSLQNYEYDRLLSGRIGLWKRMLTLYMEGNFIEKIIGLGIHSTEKTLSLYMHNEYLSTLVEMGIAGIVALITWIIFTIKTIFKKYHSYDKRYKYLIFAIFMSILVIAFGTMPFRNIVVINYLAIYLATLCTNKSRQSE